METVSLMELVKAILLWLATLCVPLATIYIMVLSSRTRKLVEKTQELGSKIDGLLVERDEMNVSKGKSLAEAAGRDTADALAEGQRQGREAERRLGAAVRAANSSVSSAKPVPVQDAEAAAIARRTAEATEQSAAAQTKIADAAEKKSQ